MRTFNKLAIFDMDGTILDTIEDLAAATNHTLRANGLQEVTVEAVRGFVGNGVEKLMERSYNAVAAKKSTLSSAKSLADNPLPTLIKEFKSYYFSHCAERTKPYEGIVFALGELKHFGVKLAVISNKPEPAVKSLCDFYFPNTFDFVVGSNELTPKKPDPTSTLATLKSAKVKIEDAVFVGDSEVDIMTGVRAKLPVVAASWGFKGRATLEGFISELEKGFENSSKSERQRLLPVIVCNAKEMVKEVLRALGL